MQTKNKSKQLWFQLSPSWVWEVREFGRINRFVFEQRERKSVGIEGVTSSRPSPGRWWLKHWMFGHGGMIRSSWEMISFTWVLGLFNLFFFLGVNALLVPTFWTFFYFGPYIFISPLLVLKPINAWHLSPYRQPTNRKSIRGWWRNKIRLFFTRGLPHFDMWLSYPKPNHVYVTWGTHQPI